MLNGGVDNWKSSKRETTTDSTTELEHIVASDGSKGSSLHKEVHL